MSYLNEEKWRRGEFKKRKKRRKEREEITQKNNFRNSRAVCIIAILGNNERGKENELRNEGRSKLVNQKKVYVFR